VHHTSGSQYVLKRRTLESIIRQAGLSAEEVRKLL
jgi:hypothetical protein